MTHTGIWYGVMQNDIDGSKIGFKLVFLLQF